MPSKKKKYNARFPAGRIKKIMQTDEEVGKVAQAVPVIIYILFKWSMLFFNCFVLTLELFVESLLTKTLKITNARNAKTLSPSHMKQCIISESRFDFLRDLVKNIPDMGINEDLSGSEAGYGNEGTSPASTSTSSSSVSYSNGGAASASAHIGSHHHLPYEVHPVSLQRSESYSPASASISLLPHHHSQPSHGKRGLSQGGSLNFYKEIPLEGTESPPPPKLNRLNSAPAGGAPTTPLPFKIDILPNLPAGSAGTITNLSNPVAKPGPTHQPSSGAITPQITYNFERLAAAAPMAPSTSLEPVIKLDYSNLRLPATSASPRGSRSTAPAVQSSLQPTIKIDLSSLATGSTALSGADGGGTPKKHIEAGAGGGGGGGKQFASPTTSTATMAANPVAAAAVAAAIQSPVASAATAPPLFSALSSTIPGMDEDYDDI
uniref:Transcription factor CBF/NF-Y/archaeal histone domain-containing protein n=1 Tax=Anopheles christyi TaxID=43041 RepID=A0A182JQ63_9DIPT